VASSKTRRTVAVNVTDVGASSVVRDLRNRFSIHGPRPQKRTVRVVTGGGNVKRKHPKTQRPVAEVIALTCVVGCTVAEGGRVCKTRREWARARVCITVIIVLRVTRSMVMANGPVDGRFTRFSARVYRTYAFIPLVFLPAAAAVIVYGVHGVVTMGHGGPRRSSNNGRSFFTRFGIPIAGSFFPPRRRFRLRAGARPRNERNNRHNTSSLTTLRNGSATRPDRVVFIPFGSVTGSTRAESLGEIRALSCFIPTGGSIQSYKPYENDCRA